jgi:hypothetical protein
MCGERCTQGGGSVLHLIFIHTMPHAGRVPAFLEKKQGADKIFSVTETQKLQHVHVRRNTPL